MIDGIGRSGAERVGLGRASVERSAAAAKSKESNARNSGSVSGSLAADLAAASGAPVDAGKIAAIRAAIADGRYPVSPARIAKAMILLDLPPERAR